jgi:hypothetical protein
MRFVFSGTIAVRFFEIFADVSVFASWTAALYSACGSTSAELFLPHDVKVRHEKVKSKIIRFSSSGDVLRRKIFISSPLLINRQGSRGKILPGYFITVSEIQLG